MKSLIAKLFGHKKKKLPIDLNQCQSVLLKPIGTAVGDTIVHLAHLRQLKKAFPHIKIGVLVTPRCEALYKASQIVDTLLTDKAPSYLSERKKWDLYLDFLPSFTSKSIILDALLAPKWIINFGKRAKKHYNLQTVKNYDESVQVPERTHFKDYLNYTSFAKALNPEVCYEVPHFSLDSEKSYWQNNNRVKILLNPQGSTRALPALELNQLLENIDTSHCELLMTNTQDSEAYFSQLTPMENLALAPKTNIFEYFALIDSADIVVSVDGGGVHIACAYHKKLLCFYANDQKNIAKWYPVTKNALCVLINQHDHNDKTEGFDIETAVTWLNQEIADSSKNLTA